MLKLPKEKIAAYKSNHSNIPLIFHYNFACRLFDMIIKNASSYVDVKYDIWKENTRYPKTFLLKKKKKKKKN